MDDAELVRRVKHGDMEAFEALYRRYADGSLRTAAAILSDRSSAADAVQETFLRVYRHIQDFDENLSFKPWLNRILANECHRLSKKTAKVMPTDLDEERDLPGEFDTYPAVEQAELYQLVQELDEPFRVPIVLKYVNDLADKDIASILELNVNTVKSRLLQAKKKLKSRLFRLEGRMEG